jgi:hypothetical protein
LCTRRYTVIFETRIIVATSATVRNCTCARPGGSGSFLFAGMLTASFDTCRAAGFPTDGIDTHVLLTRLAGLV